MDEPSGVWRCSAFGALGAALELRVEGDAVDGAADNHHGRRDTGLSAVAAEADSVRTGWDQTPSPGIDSQPEGLNQNRRGGFTAVDSLPLTGNVRPEVDSRRRRPASHGPPPEWRISLSTLSRPGHGVHLHISRFD